MKYAVLLSIFVLFASNVLAARIKQATVRVPEETDTVQIDFKNKLPLVQVKLGKNGKHYTFLIDTGAPTAISEEIADILNPPVDFEQSVNAIKETKSTVTFVRVDSLVAGKTIFKNQTAFVWNNKKTRILSCLGIDGILGSNSLNGVHHQMIWRKETIIFADKAKRFKSSHAGDAIKVHYVGVQKAPYLYSKKPRFFFLVDTGFNGYMDLNYQDLNTLLNEQNAKQINATYGNTAEGAFGISQPDTVYAIQIDSFCIGSATIPKIVGDSEKEVSAKIGNEFFENFVLTFNPKSKKLWLQPHHNQNHLPEYRFGLGLLPFNDTMRIASVDIKPPKGAEELAPGMIVLAANDYIFKQGNDINCDWLDFLLVDLKNPALKKLTLEVLNPETREIRTVVVERYPAPLYK